MPKPGNILDWGAVPAWGSSCMAGEWCEGSCLCLLCRDRGAGGRHQADAWQRKGGTRFRGQNLHLHPWQHRELGKCFPGALWEGQPCPCSADRAAGWGRALQLLCCSMHSSVETQAGGRALWVCAEVMLPRCAAASVASCLPATSFAAAGGGSRLPPWGNPPVEKQGLLAKKQLCKIHPKGVSFPLCTPA